MKKILFFGKLNNITKDINAYLSRYFQVQLCSDNLEIAKGMLKVYAPDIVLINLIGLYDIHSSFFSEIYLNYSTIPVVSIGTENEKTIFEAYYRNNQFENLTRPVDNTVVLRSICEKLYMSVNELLEEYEMRKDARKHILMVDDNVEFLRQMKAMLQDHYRVSMAASATQAMTIIGSSRPDLIILDYDMPICDGKMMLQMIRAEDRLKDVPVIFLTGISDKEHIVEVLDLKPAGYFLKPPVYD